MLAAIERQSLIQHAAPDGTTIELDAGGAGIGLDLNAESLGLPRTRSPCCGATPFVPVIVGDGGDRAIGLAGHITATRRDRRDDGQHGQEGTRERRRSGTEPRDHLDSPVRAGTC